MLLSLPEDLLRSHILPNLSLVNLVKLSRVGCIFARIATSRIDRIYKHDGSYRMSPFYEEYLREDTEGSSLDLRTVLSLMIDAKFFDPNDSLHVSEALLGDRRINSASRPLPTKCDPEISTLIFKHCTMNTPVMITAALFDSVPFELLEGSLMKKSVSRLEMYEVLLNCKNIMRVTALVPFLDEATPFLLRLLHKMDPSDHDLSDMVPDIEGICLACRLCTKESEIPPILSHISRYRNHNADLYFLFNQLIMQKIDTGLACALYKLMPADEDMNRTLILAVALFDFDISLYKTIRKDQIGPVEGLESVAMSGQVQDSRDLYLLVEAAIMLGAKEELVLSLLSNPVMEHDADLIYTAAFRGYSEQVLLAIMNTKRQGWYRSGNCLFYMVPLTDRPALTYTLHIPPSVLERLFEASVKSEFYLISGPEVYADKCYASFLEWLLENPYYTPLAVQMATRDRFQKMPQSLAVIWRHLIRTGLDYMISSVSECYRTVHRRRLKAFFLGVDRVDTAETFQSCHS